MIKKTHTIYKYCHRPFPFKIVGLDVEDNKIVQRVFEFTDSCRYHLNKGDQHDWNKLYGFSFGLFGIHRNSVRFVWRYNPNIDKIEIAAYWYVDGYRNWFNLCAIDINKPIKFKMAFFNDSVIFTVLDDYVAIAKYHLYVESNIFSKERYCCGIYFGGNRRAPQKIKIIEHYVD